MGFFCKESQNPDGQFFCLVIPRIHPMKGPFRVCIRVKAHSGMEIHVRPPAVFASMHKDVAA